MDVVDQEFYLCVHKFIASKYSPITTKPCFLVNSLFQSLCSSKSRCKPNL